MGHFVEHLVDLLAWEETASFGAVFGVVERILEEGDRDAQNLIVAGFIRYLTNADSYAGASKGPANFVPWLGPQVRNLAAIQHLL